MKMSEWKQSAELMEAVGMSTGGGGGNLFVKLKSGDSVTGVFLGEPVSRAIVWDDSLGHSVKYDPNVHAKNELRLKHAWNFFDTEAKEIRILETNHATRISLGEVAAKIEAGGSELDRWICKISRRGSGKDTQYWIDNVQEMNAQQLEWMASTFGTDAHDLRAIMNDGQAATAAKTAHEAPAVSVVAPVAAPVVPVAPVAAPVAPVAAPVVPVAPVAAPVVGPGSDFDLF